MHENAKETGAEWGIQGIGFVSLDACSEMEGSVAHIGFAFLFVIPTEGGKSTEVGNTRKAVDPRAVVGWLRGACLTAEEVAGVDTCLLI